ncbi:UNVERIFIED_CONTAM: hypothetical protein FKN15_048617 [Acipenser sinensis]
MEFRRRRGFPVTLGTRVLSILMLGVCSVSASEFESPEICELHCGAGLHPELQLQRHSWRRLGDQLEDQLPQYVNRTSLSDSELQHGDASLLMRRVTLEDARTYRCDVYAPKQLGWGLIELILVQAEPTTPAQHQHQLIWLVVLLPPLLGVFEGQWLCKKYSVCW